MQRTLMKVGEAEFLLNSESEALVIRKAQHSHRCTYTRLYSRSQRSIPGAYFTALDSLFLT